MIGRRPGRKAAKIVLKRLDGALAELDRRDPLPERVHDLRLRLKKARAALKLLRPEIGERRYRRGNALCRDAARQLSATRDAQALLTAWRGLGVRIPAVERELADGARRAAARLARDRAAWRRSRGLLRRAREELRDLSPRASWKGLSAGLRRTYEAALEAGRKAAEDGAEASFHEWRKRVKDQRYQIDLLIDGSKDLRRYDDALRELSDALGDEHDLSVLRGAVADAPERFGGRRSGAALLALARRKRSLRRRIIRLARPVYGLRPGEYARRVKQAWKLSRRR